jgi:hemolysin III
MTVPPELAVRPRLRGVSHLYAFFGSITLTVALVATAPSGAARAGAAVYAATLVGMFGASALYHRRVRPAAAAHRLLKLDHTAIFLVIAGTATPILLLTNDGLMRVLMLSLVWMIALAGIAYEWMPVSPPRGYVTSVFLVLGWIGLFAVGGGLWTSTEVAGVALVAGGGILYTTGAIVHAARRPDPWPEIFGYHELFHVLVIAAAALHYCAIAFLVLPLAPK